MGLKECVKMLSETNKTTARQGAERQGEIMSHTYIYAYKRVNETTWHLAETTINMNERDFLRWMFDTTLGTKIDKVRILEIKD